MLKLAIITGLSGSGKSTARKCFEDMGYFTIDNLPVAIMEDFLRLTSHTTEGISKIAMVMDARAGDTINLLPVKVDSLRQQGYEVELIYLEADDSILTRRYSETRRKHPLSPDGSPAEGIAKEKEILKTVRQKSDFVINTSEFNIHDLHDRLSQTFLGTSGRQQKMVVRLTSFGFKYGAPQDADLLFDVRFLPNPFFRGDMRDSTGLNAEVADYVFQAEAAQTFRKKLLDLVQFLLPLYIGEGKSYLHIAIGCTGGKHRSVAMIHWLADSLEEKMGVLQVKDRDIEKA